MMKVLARNADWLWLGLWIVLGLAACFFTVGFTFYAFWAVPDLTPFLAMAFVPAFIIGVVFLELNYRMFSQKTLPLQYHQPIDPKAKRKLKISPRDNLPY